MLREAGEFENTIIACGGGTPCFNGNMDYMLERGLTLFLDTSAECMTRRLVENSSRRPLMAGKTPEEVREAVADGLTARLPHYSRATIRFSGDDLEDRRQISVSIKKFLAAHPEIIS